MKNKSKKKEIIFFDGDGTIWYPRKTKYKEKPHWIYSLHGSYKDHSKHLMMVATVLNTLKILKERGIITVLLSTHPQPPKEAYTVVRHRIKHFDLDKLFDEVHATREYHASKSEFILDILKKRKIAKSRALMVGDSYRWDYKPARDIGVDALLIESEYIKKDAQGKRVKKTIKRLSNLLDYI